MTLVFGSLAGLNLAQLCGQSAAPKTNQRPVFKVNARTVVVNVVVTDRNGKPAKGLHQSDFLVAEDGKSQKITSFEEHSGAPPTMPANCLICRQVPSLTSCA
jgi:hypothetical protein